ncbi:MAG: MFS transporter [Capnocytophaga sp.]|nr:MFS transporter [Capnocytophaga sp.]
MQKKFIPLALGGLAIGTTEFVIMGILPDVAATLGISIPTAGHLISSYALGVVVGAPILVGYSAKFPPKKILTALMVLFTVFNALSALAPSYETMMAARFFSGLPHGAFFGVGTVVAVRLARVGKQAQAVAAMFSGLTVANLAMVPVAVFIAHLLHWRVAFGIVALLGLATLIALRWWLPILDSQRTVGLRSELQFFKTGRAWNIIAITSIGFCGLFAWFSYISPLLTKVSGFAEESVSYIMVLAGAGMVVGNHLGGILADKIKPLTAVGLLLLLMIVALVAVYLFSENKIASLVLTFTCGALSMSAGTPLNMLMLRAAKNSEMMAAAFMQAAFNVANSLGAFFGGLPLVYGLSYNYPSLVGAALALLGVVLVYIYYRNYGKEKNI